MGISSIFKRTKPLASTSQQDAFSNIAKDGGRPRHIKRRPTTSDGSSSDERKQHQLATLSANNSASRKHGKSSAIVGGYSGKTKTTRVVSESHAYKTGRKYVHPASIDSVSEVDDLPTPEKSIDESYGAHYTRDNRKNKPSKPAASQQQKRQTDISPFGLHRLTTPPLDTQVSQLKEIDPFEDSPPPRPLTNFEDPVYIPPLTLAATLVDDYGAVGTVLGGTTTTTSTSLVPPTISSRSTAVATPASIVASGRGSAGLGSTDFFSDFNATYSYLFGTLPSSDLGSSGTTNGSSANAAATTTTKSRNATQRHSNAAAGSHGGLLSPMSTDAAGKPLKASDVESSSLGEKSDNDSDSSDGGLASDGDSDNESGAAQRELEEERRKEDERKAAELRSRRREQLKQQVAFERMKERHRRQFPGQSAGGAPTNIVRWQKESANAIGLPASSYNQNALNASYATINRGYAQGAAAQISPANQGHAGAHSNSGSNGIYASIHANASMPNIGYSAENQLASGANGNGNNNGSTLLGTVQRPISHHPQQHPHQQQYPLLVDTSGASRAAVVNGYHYNGYNSLPHSAQAISGKYQALPNQASFIQLQQQAQIYAQQQLQPVPVATDQTVPSAHPVKLALSMSKSIKNPYLSDSSDDNDEDDDSDVSSRLDSDDISSIGSSDISCDVSFADDEPAQGTVVLRHSTSHCGDGSSINNSSGGVSGVRVARSVSQPAMAYSGNGGSQTAVSDSSSDKSAKSQSSSKRRVRFHETVSVVFNTTNSVTEEEMENSVYDSDNDSSNASIDLVPGLTRSTYERPAESNGSALLYSEFAHDEAFDDSNGFSHSRYMLPRTFVSRAASGMQWYDDGSTTAANSKGSSSGSSRNISPDGAGSRKQKPKHRVETQPLRDREAEREQQKIQIRIQKQNDKVGAMTKQGADQIPTSSLSGAHQIATSASSDAQSSTESTVTAFANMSPTSPVDPVLEARRALLGHYSVPNPAIPIGNGIPRSNNSGSAFVRTSSVKIVQPPSFARPKPASATASSSSTRKSFSGRSANKSSSKADVSDKPKSAFQPAKQTLKTNKQQGDLESSQEFNFSNVLQNFSIASFEMSKDREGGVHIRYSDRDNSAKDQGDDDSSSDGDDLPLSSIARSRSEPGANLPRHSADNYTRRLNASTATGSSIKGSDSRNYDLDDLAKPAADALISESLKSNWRFFGRSQNSSTDDKKVLVRNTTAVAKTDGQIPKLSEMRSLSMDSGSRHSIIAQSAVTTDSGKKWNSRWGNIF
ncbi:hypothetical protein LPJ64_003555 [Coemansia asiatica]|uniref:Uncharacterized protein n=1 Tax=Coemansia asiatica TaxID=1052880 RepID=A0A9W8CI37_9FUNG|nr:hypothetical protein LPJ64_003555 [Coemansia asiatica]